MKALILSVTVENTSDHQLIWNLIPGQVVLSTREYIAGGSPFYSDNMDGIYYGKQKKAGNLIFDIKGDADHITSFTYIMDSPLEMKTDVPTSVGTEKAVHITLVK
jgi:hypothetical protein